jgi:broad-specificity NMP kinase
MVKSMFSDEVMLTALRNLGWISKNYFQYHKKIILDNCLCDFPPPHLTIYLDAPAEVCMERIKQRNDPRERGPNMNIKFLQAVEAAYRDRWLDKQRVTGEVLEIDWTEVGQDVDIDVIADEISRLTLDNVDPESPKFKEWWVKGGVMSEDRAGQLRQICSHHAYLEQYFMRRGPIESPEVFASYEVRMKWRDVMMMHPGAFNQSGTAKELGGNANWKFFNYQHPTN